MTVLEAGSGCLSEVVIECPAMAITIGTTVKHGTDLYLVKDILSSGGFGVAYLAERQAPGSAPTMVVVKVPAAHVIANPIWSQKFSREARILANIRHPNVVKIISFWEFPGTGEKALVQELVTGALDLSKFLSANPDWTGSLLLQTFYALRAFHSMTSPSAVHRDLSPRNILVSDSGLVKVIDFGLAKEDPRVTQTLTVAGEWFGTPGCISPEQLHDAASVDHRTDLFAVGRSFAAALQGRHPQVARPEKLSEPWKTLCVRLTEDDPNDRPSSAAEALSEAMSLIASSGMPLQSFPFHVSEMRKNGSVPSWPILCQEYLFQVPDYDNKSLRVIGRIDAEVFNPPFDVNGLFDRVERSSGIQAAATGNLDFDDADPIGELYARLFPHLATDRRMQCFQQICRMAIRYHRYSVMQDVRNAYAAEGDRETQRKLVEILDAEDPGRIIEGRGVLPRSP